MISVVDVSFKLKGSLLSVDHGYLLYSAISKIIDGLHSNSDIGVHPISGKLVGNRLLTLTDGSKLTFRLPSDQISMVLPLAGKVLLVGAHEVQVEVPRTYILKPTARLYSRLVVIKGYTQPDMFLEAAQRQLDKMEIKGKPHLIHQTHVIQDKKKGIGTSSHYLRRTIKIRDKEIVGFAVGVEELNAEESILLQEMGLGGRRRFGCGIFIPNRR